MAGEVRRRARAFVQLSDFLGCEWFNYSICLTVTDITGLLNTSTNPPDGIRSGNSYICPFFRWSCPLIS